jgi:predicted nucleic acid-binding protein
MITMDTSGLYAIFNRRDPYHAQMKAARDADAGPYVVPAGMLAELAWMTEQTLDARVLQAFLLDLADGSYLLDCGDRDFRRIHELVLRYADLRLGFVDSVVIACAERHGGKVLTCDRRHFPVVARGERSIIVVPE